MTATMTKPQPLTALDKANQFRQAQGELLRMLSDNKASLESTFEREEAASLPLLRVLEALPHRSDRVIPGAVRKCTGTAKKIVRRAGISIDREVGSIKCPKTRKKILDAAYDFCGSNAWVFENDTPPKLVGRKNSPGGTQSDKQRTIALAKANVIRSRRKEMKEALAAGEMTVGDVFEDPASETWKVGQILAQAPRLDPVTGKATGSRNPSGTHLLLRRLSISPVATVGSLTPRQTNLLLAELPAVLVLKYHRKEVVA